jgi:hypothetical protein
LWKVPFEALPAGDGDLAGLTQVTYATSLATLAVQRRIAGSRSAPERLAAATVAILGPTARGATLRTLSRR